MQRKILRGLKVSDFIHPNELVAQQAALSNETVRKYLNTAAELCTNIVDPITQGTFVKINEDSEPMLIRIVREVCEILDVTPVPDVYLCHLMYVNISPYGSEVPYLVVPDYVLRYIDEDMLYYNVGNAITMLKADHVELATIAAYMPGGGLIEIPKLLFTKYLHCADSTSDRGGLLACQSFSAAVRNHFWELGIPPSKSAKFLSDDKSAEIFVEKYLTEQAFVLERFNGIFTRAARFWQRMAYLEAPTNKMLREIFDWYKDPKGYNAVLSKYTSER